MRLRIGNGWPSLAYRERLRAPDLDAMEEFLTSFGMTRSAEIHRHRQRAGGKRWWLGRYRACDERAPPKRGRSRR
jgi:hypothetical protein